MTQLFLIALGTLASEDLTCIATGALIADGKIQFLPGVLACIAGILVGDLLLYFVGRLFGRPIARWRPIRKLFSDEKLDRASSWLAARGASVIVLSRFTPGLRLPTYVAAGLLKTHFWSFAFYFLLAAVIWTPAMVGAAALFGKSFPRSALIVPAILIGMPWRNVRRLFCKLRWTLPGQAAAIQTDFTPAGRIPESQPQ
jgi:membrane protein DedA with SNARE-associated domain